MSSTEFETVSSDGDTIMVRHISTGFVFGYKVVPNPSGERLLQLNGMQEGDTPGENWQHIASRAQIHAQSEMKADGRLNPQPMIDRRITW